LNLHCPCVKFTSLLLQPSFFELAWEGQSCNFSKQTINSLKQQFEFLQCRTGRCLQVQNMFTQWDQGHKSTYRTGRCLQMQNTFTEWDQGHKPAYKTGRCSQMQNMFTQWDQGHKPRYRQEDVYKCKIRSHRGTRVTN